MKEFRRRATFTVLLCAAAAGALVLMWLARFVLLLLFAGILGGLLLSMVIEWLRSWIRLPRALAFAIVLSVGIALIGVGSWLRGPALAGQLSDLQTDIPAAVEQLRADLHSHALGRWLMEQVTNPDRIAGFVRYAIPGIRGAMYLTGTTLAALFLALMVSLYLAAEPQSYLRGLRRIVPVSLQPKLDACLFQATKMLKTWFVAKLLSMVAVGVFVTVGLLILRVPLAGTLGAIAALLAFIPNLGPILSVVPAVLLAFAISPLKGFLTILLFCLAHLLDGNLVTPLAERKIVTLPPALTLGFQLLMAAVAGALGVALAAPLLAALLGILGALIPPEQDRPEKPTAAKDEAYLGCDTFV